MASPLTKNQDTLYADLRKDMLLNPVNSDVTRYTDEQSVKEAIKNILMINQGEKLFNPTFGGSLRNLLFDNITLGKETIIRKNIQTSLNNYEPRANILNVKVQLFNNTNSAEITIVFKVINSQEPVTLSVILDRAR